MMRRSKLAVTATGLIAGGLALTACGASNTGGGDEAGADGTNANEASPWADCDLTEGIAELPDPTGTGEDATTIDIGAFRGWDESYAASYLFKAIMEEQGYTVNVEEYDAAPMYTGLANGDIDLSLDTWLPLTHEDYLAEYGDSMESLGCWYDNAKLTIAVNEDAPIDSLDELAGAADEFGGVLYGIEEGAGLTRVTRESAIPDYGLEGELRFTPSGTPAMLTELKNKTEAGENVAVTLWRPHWAYDAFPVKDLEDPKGSMGEAEYIYSFGKEGFSEEFPNAAQLVRNFVFDDEALSSLEKLMFSEDEFGGTNHEAAVAEWLAGNPDFAEQLRSGSLGG